MADAGLPWSIPNAGFSIQPINGEFAAWSRGSSVPPDGWSVLSGTWSATLSRCQGGTGPYAVDFGQAGIPSTLVSDYIVVLPNTRYLLSALYRIVTGSGAALSQGVRVDWYNDSRSLISSDNVDLITNTAGVWTYSGADITSPIQAVYAKVVVGRFNVNGSTNLQVDAIKLDRAVYIPSGVISLDDVTDGATYARPKGAFMDAGRIKEVMRGAGTVATDFLFKKTNIADPDTIDGVPDGATYGRPKLDGLTSGYPNLDKVVDGATYARVKGTMLTAGEITSLSRGGSTYATTTFFQKALDSLDNVVDGVTYGRPKLDGLVSGYPSMDKVVDGTTYGRVKNTMLTSGEVTSLSRGGTTYATSTFFQKALDTLDNVANGTTYARVNATALSAGNPKTDSLVDGTYAKVLATQLTSGAITSLTRGGVSYATTTFFNTGLDTLDNVPNGTTYARVNASALSSGNPKTDSLVDGTYSKVAATYVDATSKAITTIRNTTLNVDIAGSAVFRKSTDTLDDVAEGTTYKRLLAGAVTSGYPSSVWRDGAALATSSLFKVGVNTLDDMAEGVTYKRLAAGAVTSGYPSSVWRDGASLATSSLFKKSSDTLDSVLDGTTYARVNATALSSGNPKMDSVVDGTSYRKVAVAYVNASNQITAVRRAGADESVDNLFKKSSDTFASVAGTLSDGQLGSNVVNTSNIKDGNITTAKVASLAITGPKLDDGISLSAYDEETVAGIASRTTATNATKGAWDGAIGYIRLTLAIGSTNPQLSTGLATGTSTNLRTTNAVMRYRISGGASGAVTKLEAINTANVAQTATAVFLADGNWHTAVFDLSGWATAGTLRIDLTTNALGSTGYWDVAYIATGVAGSGTGALISSQGNVGVGTATPGQKLSVRGGIMENSSDGTTDSRIAFVQTNGANYPVSWLGIPSWNKTTLYLTGPTATGDEFAAWYGNATWQFLTGGTDRMRINSSGNVGIGTTSPQSKFSVTGASAAQAGDGITGIAQFTTGTGLNTDEKLQLGVVDGSYSWLQAVKPGTSYRNLALNPSGGKVGIGVTAPEEQLEVRTGSSSYGLLQSNGTIKVGTYISTAEAQFGTKSNHDFALFTNNGAGRLRIMATGEVRVPALAGVGNRAVYSDANGNLTNTASDSTLKQDIQPIENALPVVMGMNPVSFSWKDQDRFGPYTEVGFLAQEMLELVPFVVGKNADDTFTIDYPKLTAVLARAIQELKQQVDELANSRS